MDFYNKKISLIIGNCKLVNSILQLISKKIKKSVIIHNNINLCNKKNQKKKLFKKKNLQK